MADDDTFTGAPGDRDCPDESLAGAGAPPTRESILARLDELLADSGGAYSADKMPAEQAIRYSLIAACKQTSEALTPCVSTLAQNVVARVEYIEQQLERIVRPQRTIIRSRCKRQDQQIKELLSQLGNCIAARTSHCQAELADCQAKMLGAQYSSPGVPAPYPDSGNGYDAGEGVDGPPSPAALGYTPPQRSATSDASAKPCTYIDVCDRDGWWAWWYYWYAWVVWWWSWFRWYLRAAWICWAKRCGLPAAPYSAEGMAYVIELEKSAGTPTQANPSGIPSVQGGSASASASFDQMQYHSLQSSLAQEQIAMILQAANSPDPDKAMSDLFGTEHEGDVGDPQTGLVVAPIEDEHWPIEDLPEE